MPYLPNGYLKDFDDNDNINDDDDNDLFSNIFWMTEFTEGWLFT